jgi:hypothetical protein
MRCGQVWSACVTVLWQASEPVGNPIQTCAG